MMEEFGSYMELMMKCVVVYFVIILALRLMGKREVGELSVFDIVIYLVMSELLAISISDQRASIFHSLVPIAILAFLQIAISWVLLKSKRIRDVFDGKAVILIENGSIDQRVMRRERYSKDLSSPDEVAFAILENNGTLSILPKKSCRVRYPHPLISDGQVNREALAHIGKDEAWLTQEMAKQGAQVQDVFLCLYQKDGLFVMKRQLK